MFVITVYLQHKTQNNKIINYLKFNKQIIDIKDKN
jgi:hypothetical protein